MQKYARNGVSIFSKMLGQFNGFRVWLQRLERVDVRAALADVLVHLLMVVIEYCHVFGCAMRDYCLEVKRLEGGNLQEFEFGAPRGSRPVETHVAEFIPVTTVVLLTNADKDNTNE